MSTAEFPQTTGFAGLSRALVAAAADLAAGLERAVVGTDNVRTARQNAWDAILADRARAQARADLDRTVAALLKNDSPTRRPRKPSLV